MAKMLSVQNENIANLESVSGITITDSQSFNTALNLALTKKTEPTQPSFDEIVAKLKQEYADMDRKLSVFVEEHKKKKERLASIITTLQGYEHLAKLRELASRYGTQNFSDADEIELAKHIKDIRSRYGIQIGISTIMELLTGGEKNG